MIKAKFRVLIAISCLLMMASACNGNKSNDGIEHSKEPTIAETSKPESDDKEEITPNLNAQDSENKNQQIGLLNGDFETGTEEGFTILFDDWGEGENKATYSFVMQNDNFNKTNKLNISNNIGKDNNVSIVQEFITPEDGTYIIALDYEGGDGLVGLSLNVNNSIYDFEKTNGWNYWSQINSEPISLNKGDVVRVEISGVMNQGDWYALDNLIFEKESNFSKTSFEKPVVIELKNQSFTNEYKPNVFNDLTNGDFEKFSADGSVYDWDVKFTDWGKGSKNASVSITKDSNNVNNSQKLSIGNNLDKDNTVSISQKFYAINDGEIIVSLDFEGDYNSSGLSLIVNGISKQFNDSAGWNNWTQVYSEPIHVKKGDVITIEISGNMKSGDWYSLDNISYDKKAEFDPKVPQDTEENEEQKDQVYDNLFNGDFDIEPIDYDDFGWDVTFANWGEGEKLASYSIVEQLDSVNTSNKLLISNNIGLNNAVSISQKFKVSEEDEYIVSLDFEGGENFEGLYLCVNEIEIPFSKATGWNNIQKIHTEKISFQKDEIVEISIKGIMKNGDWYTIDNISINKASEFTPQVAVEEVVQEEKVYDSLFNGDFDIEPIDYDNLGWDISFANWGAEERNASYAIAKDNNDVNTTSKLSISNNTGEANEVTITQSFYAENTEEIVIALDYRGGQKFKGLSLTVNGESKELPQTIMWKIWNRTSSAPIEVQKGEKITVTISGILKDEEWYNFDNIMYMTSDEYDRYKNEYGITNIEPERKPSPTPEIKEPSRELINGDFSTGMNWNTNTISGWTLPTIDWDIWEIEANNAFQVKNKTSNEAIEEFIMKQDLVLPAGSYMLLANSPWGYVDGNPASVELSVISEDEVISTKSQSVGHKHFSTPSFSLEEESIISVEIKFKVPGTSANEKIYSVISNIEIIKADDIVLQSAEQVGGVSNVTDTSSISLKLNRDMSELTVENINITGADKKALTSYGDGFYSLEIENIEAEGVTANISLVGLDNILDREIDVTLHKDTSTLEVATPVLINGDFSTGMNWNTNTISGWTLPTIDWDIWEIEANNAFQVKNITSSLESQTFEISQNVIFGAGTYNVSGDIPWGNEEEYTSSSVTIEVSDLAGNVRSTKSEYIVADDTKVITPNFSVSDEEEIKITIRFSAMGTSDANKFYSVITDVAINKVK